MRSILWNDGWKFWPDKDAFGMVWNIPETAQDVTLPHDAMIGEKAYAESRNGGNTGYRDGGSYTYVKRFVLPAGDAGKKYVVRFDGVYGHTLVFINEQCVGSQAYGYTTFYADLSDYLHFGGENELRVLVKNSNMPNSRWYSGSGIYRDVYLLESGPIRIREHSVTVETERADRDVAAVLIQAVVANGTNQAKILQIRTIMDGNEETTKVMLRAGEERKVRQRITLREPRLWSAEHPELYTVEMQLLCGGELLDSEQLTTGIRILGLDAVSGLSVNGETVKLRGACIHHDSGILGAATYSEVLLRQARILKEAGFNAVRISHHPAAPALLHACDQVGLYVMDEFSDMWNRPKSDLDYSLSFQSSWRDDVRAMVSKDINHPSVVLYSIGNEIPEICSGQGSALAAEISGLFHELDPRRYCTAGINGVFAAGEALGEILQDITAGDGAGGGNVNDFMTIMDTRMDEIVTHPAMSRQLEKACAALDVAGYNYMSARYEQDALQYPNRIIVGSETYPPQIARNWELVCKLPSVIGDFTWTGWDYIGEAGVGVPAYQWGDGGFGAHFPCQLAYCADIDLTGFRRPLSYYRETVYGLRKQPYIAVQDPHHYGQFLIKTPWVMSDAVSTWSWGGCENNPVIVEVYSAGDEIELFLNGRSLGRKKAGEDLPCRTLFDTIYEPGTLTAVSYEKGEEIGRTDLRSATGPVHFSLREEALGEDVEGQLIYVDVTLEDESGTTASDQDCQIDVSVTGGAVLLGCGSADPKPVFNYPEPVSETWNGRALLILKRISGEPYQIDVKRRTDHEDQ